MSSKANDQWVALGREALNSESEALQAAAESLGASFSEAVEMIAKLEGKVIVTGLGKSGHVARKAASTLASTGTSAFFVHPAEALHGDFGMIQNQDCLLAIAFGGETAEVLEVARYARRIGIPIVAITGRQQSSLAGLAHYVLDGGVAREADPHNLAPTASSTVAMALGDALAVALMRAKGFAKEDFASLHPGGSLGRKLSRVADHMRPQESLGSIGPDANFHDILEAVTSGNYGICAVLDGDQNLIGAISDGDVRRSVLNLNEKALATTAKDLIKGQPRSVSPQTLALDAVRLMNEAQITQLFVCEGDGRKLLGLVRMHDLLAAKIV